MNIIALPNINANPKIVQPTIIGTKSYTFSYNWRENGYCTLDIMLGDVTLLNGRPMTTGSDLIARVKNSDLITGSLFLINKYGQLAEPTQENFNTDFYLTWVE